MSSDLSCFLTARNNMHFASVSEKLHWIAHYFLGKPYIVPALGEGEASPFPQAPFTHPLFRMDGFDCVTYVNTVLTLMQSGSIEVVIPNMLTVNYYGGEPSFYRRFHFISVDWLPALRNQGVLKDVTETLHQSVFSGQAPTVCDVIHRKRFLMQALPNINDKEVSAELTKIGLLSEEAAELAYVPLTECMKLSEAFVRALPDCGVALIVRKNWPELSVLGTRLLVSHLGFFIKNHGEVEFFHASSNEKKVVCVPLGQYIKTVCMPIQSIVGLHFVSI